MVGFERENLAVELTEPREVPQRRGLCQRLGCFLLLHFAALLSEILAILDFILTENYSMICAMTAPLLLSGMVCTHAAWRAEPVQLLWSWGLPLRNQSLLLKAVLWVPLGLLQGVIVLLAYDEYLDRQEHQQGHPQQRESFAWNRYHCKAVAALCEGLPALTVIVCSWWSLNYPPEDPLMRMSWSFERQFLGILGIVLFISAGSGMVELDYCCSGAVAREMQKSLRYELLHLLFRVSEVLTRTVMMVAFMVTTRRLVWWWWCPAASNLLFTYMLVLYHGGDEVRSTVRLLCCVPCAWVNLFCFVDSPYKRRAARKISRWLDVKFLLEVLVLPLMVCAAAAARDGWDDLQKNVAMHCGMFVGMFISLFVYFFLWLWMQCTILWQIDMIDIFTASEKGNTQEVKEVMERLVAEVKELTRSASADIDLNRPDVDGNTPLMLAVREGHAEVCKFLVVEGALVGIKHSGRRNLARNRCSRACQSSWTALHLAAWLGKDRIIRALLEGGALEEEGKDYVDEHGETPLHVAARAGQLEAARLLALACPRWTATADSSGRRPADLTRSEGLRMSLARSWGSWDPEHFQAQALAAVEELGVPSAHSRPSSQRRSSSVHEDWCSVPLHISRKCQLLVAPGLCSYVAASCGGALGRLCLTKAEEEGSQVFDQPLRLEDLVRIDLWGREVSCFGEANPWQNAPALIGEGRFGEVFRAKHRQTGTWYAVKVFKTQQRPVAPEVVRECEVGTHVRQTPHPCIVRLYMVNFDDAGLYTLVMEFCPSNLLQQVRNAKRLRAASTYRPPEQTVDWLGQIFLGLEHMHRRLNTLFRDLKPENVVLDSLLCCKLADFGAGRLGPSSGTFSFGHPAGSPGYIAPEVLGGMPHDECADLYSLGVLTWLLFTGGLPNEVPPMAKPPQWQAHCYDWWMLATCVANNFPPFQGMENATNDQADQARNFVDLLVKPPTTRMRHGDLRQHPLLLPLRLPRYSAGPCQVEAWLQERGFAKKVESRPSSKSWNSGGELQRRENHICAGQDELSAKFRSIQVSSRADSCT
ncbi:unnamed protein product [Effrenium voratum]|nr:unnamed protein product [Effrenium voratum]